MLGKLNIFRPESAVAPLVRFWLSSNLWLAPVVTGLLLVLLAWLVREQIQEDRNRATWEAEVQMSALADKYAERTKLQLHLADQFLLTVKWEAEQHPRTIDLLRMQAHNLLPAASHMRVSLIDAKGFQVQSTSSLPAPPSGADRPFFKALATNPDAGLIVTKTESRRTARESLLLTRRVNNPDGAFRGIAIIGVDVDLFLTFLDTESLAEGSFIGLLGADGTYYAFRPSTPELQSQKDNPPPMLMATSEGKLRLETGPDDPLSRTFAWRSIPGYGVTAVVSQRTPALSAQHRETRSRYYREGLGASLFVLLLGCSWFIAAYRARARQLKRASSVSAYRMAAEGSNDAFLVEEPVHDAHGTVIDFVVVDCNARAEVMHGLAPGRLVGVKLTQLVPGARGKQLVSLYAQILKSGAPSIMNDVEVPPSSRLRARWISRRLIPVGDGLAITLQDITVTKEQARALADMAFEDALTGLPNRRWLTENLPQVIERCRAKSAQAALLFIDLDNFKAVNDTLGHEAGDELLKETALRVRAAIREDDVLCRLGGDELTVILESFSSMDEVTRVCERILTKLSSPLVINGTSQETVVSASVGISLYPSDAAETGTLIKCADLAMYSAKEQGKGTYQFYCAQLSARAESRATIEQALRHAISRDELVIAYQPKVRLGKHSAVIGSEALLRWNHPQKGVVMPGDFIGLAEETGLIDAIGHHVLHLACRQLSAWREAGIPLLPVSINVSPRQFISGDIVEAIHSALALYNLPGSILEIEITEQSMLGQPERVRKLLAPLKEMGVRIAVDDFGSGYSNLAQLGQLDVDVLKIDRSLVNQVPQNGGVSSVVEAVINMAKAMHMEVIAEGVETVEQLTFLEQLDCHAAQGYYFSRPVMVDKWVETLAEIQRKIASGACVAADNDENWNLPRRAAV